MAPLSGGVRSGQVARETIRTMYINIFPCGVGDLDKVKYFWFAFPTTINTTQLVETIA